MCKLGGIGEKGLEFARHERSSVVRRSMTLPAEFCSGSACLGATGFGRKSESVGSARPGGVRCLPKGRASEEDLAAMAADPAIRKECARNGTLRLVVGLR
jgi:hypothetical protein